MSEISLQTRRAGFSVQILLIIDALIVWGCFSLANFLRDPLAGFILSVLEVFEEASVSASIPENQEVTWILTLAIFFVPLTLEILGFYRLSASKRSVTALRQLIQAITVFSAVIALAVLFFKYSTNSRLVLGSAIFISTGALFLRDRCICYYLRHLRRSTDLKERVILVGSSDNLEAFLKSLPKETVAFWNVKSQFNISENDPEDLATLISEHSVERVIFAAVDTDFAKVSKAVEVCETQGVEAWIRASFVRTNIARPQVDVLGNQPMLVLRSTPEASWSLIAKEVIDRVGSFCLLLLALPVLILAYLGILIVSPGASPFFIQQRSGRYGKAFGMWKFRTMVPNAESLLSKLKEEQGNEMSGPVFKLQDDPRIFPFGKILRKLSIDELPQLFNVVMGDMSLVGPRPLPVYEVEQFEKNTYRRRLSMKPGITCIWQAGGRNKITKFEDWVKMDLEYIDKWSLWLDMKLLLKTVPAVLFGKGAK